MRAGRLANASVSSLVMDWSDDVAYSVHDVEDGVHAVHIDLAAVRGLRRAEVCALAKDWYAQDADTADPRLLSTGF